MTAACWRSWITGLQNRNTVNCFLTVCQTTVLRSNWPTWRTFSMFEVAAEYSFAAGHALRHYKGKCENVHGHNYKIRITVEGQRLNAIGLLVDFVELKKNMRAVADRLDHQFINDLEPFTVIN